jgi:hypothetical protein
MSDPLDTPADSRFPAGSEGAPFDRTDGTVAYRVDEPDGTCHVFDGEGKPLLTISGSGHEVHERTVATLPNGSHVRARSLGYGPNRAPVVYIAPRPRLNVCRGRRPPMRDRQPRRRAGTRGAPRESRAGPGDSESEPEPPGEHRARRRGAVRGPARKVRA